ncbi:MAG: hypothetical protein V4631_15740 [Pseudomonadota bacterium]
MSDETHKATVTAAQFFADAARKFIVQDGRLHAETLILSMGRMSGSLMYRSFGIDPSIAPGTGVLSDAANIHGPK